MLENVFREPAFWLYFLAWLPYLLYVVIYGFFSPWYSSRIGRGLLLTKLAIVLVLTNVLIIIVVGDYAWKDTIRGALIGLVVVASWYQLFVLIRTRWGPRNPENPRRRSTDIA